MHCLILSSKPQAFAFVSEDLPEERVREIKIALENTGQLSEFRYITKEEALEIYREQNKDEPALLEQVTSEILPASIEISAVSAKDLEDLVQVLQRELPGSDIQFQSEIIETMIRVTEAVRLAGGTLLGLQIVIMVMVILLIVAMKISARREEIGILRLIGASFWYIRRPFMLEAIFYGVVSAALAWAGLIGSLEVLKPMLDQFLLQLPIYPFPVWFLLTLLGGMTGAGFIIGLLGSFTAVWRHLR